MPERKAERLRSLSQQRRHSNSVCPFVHSFKCQSRGRAVLQQQTVPAVTTVPSGCVIVVVVSFSGMAAATRWLAPKAPGPVTGEAASSRLEPGEDGPKLGFNSPHRSRPRSLDCDARPGRRCCRTTRCRPSTSLRSLATDPAGRGRLSAVRRRPGPVDRRHRRCHMEGMLGSLLPWAAGAGVAAERRAALPGSAARRLPPRR